MVKHEFAGRAGEIKNIGHASLDMTYALCGVTVTNYTNLSKRCFREAEPCSKIHITSLDPDEHDSAGHFQG